MQEIHVRDFMHSVREKQQAAACCHKSDYNEVLFKSLS